MLPGGLPPLWPGCTLGQATQEIFGGGGLGCFLKRELGVYFTQIFCQKKALPGKLASVSANLAETVSDGRGL